MPNSARCKSYDSFLNSLTNGQRVSFRLAANPVKAVKQKNQRGRVFPHITSQYQLQYLEKRAKALGFSLVENEYKIVQRDFPILMKGGGKKMKLARAIYEGELIIEDIEIFKKALTNGIGKEKAYGFGMMTVIP